MKEKEFDQKLNIRTEGIRELPGKPRHYNRYEATPYIALEKLIDQYQLKPTDQVVDFGSGRGRVSFFLHYHFDIPVTGIEMSDPTLDEALQNKTFYERKHKHLTAPIRFEYGLAENYPIHPEDNVFYFFHPFSLKIFKQVVENIIQSTEENKRPVDIIFYYPLPEFKKFLKKEKAFRLVNKIKAYKRHGRYGKFLIFRLD